MNKILKKFVLVSSLPFLTSACDKKETVSKESYDNMYNHFVYCWNQSLQGLHFDNVFYGDSRVIGADFVGAFKDKSVINLGVGGDRVKNLIQRFDLIKTVTPNRVFLAIGGNDALSGEYNKDTFTVEYNTLLSMFKDGGYDVIIHTVVGLTTINSALKASDVEEKNSKISEVNSIIKSCAESYNYTLVDIAPKMNKSGTNEMNPDYSSDGVHFNNVGNQFWYNEISSFLI